MKSSFCTCAVGFISVELKVFTELYECYVVLSDGLPWHERFVQRMFDVLYF